MQRFVVVDDDSDSDDDDYSNDDDDGDDDDDNDDIDVDDANDDAVNIRFSNAEYSLSFIHLFFKTVCYATISSRLRKYGNRFECKATVSIAICVVNHIYMYSKTCL